MTKTQFDTLFGAVGACSVCGGKYLDHPGKHEMFIDDFDDKDYEDDDPAGENSDGDEIESSEEEHQHGDKLMQEDLNFVEGVEPLLSKKQLEIYNKIKPRLKDALAATSATNQQSDNTTREVVNGQQLSQRVGNGISNQNINASTPVINTLKSSNVQPDTIILNNNLPVNKINEILQTNTTNQEKNHNNTIHDIITLKLIKIIIITILN